MPALDVLSSLIPAVWSFFTETMVPGLNVPFSSFFLAVVMIRISLAFIRHAFGFGGDAGYRSGTAHNPKISDDRKDDAF